MTRFAAAATYAIAGLAFALSYANLAALADRAGYSPVMAHVWPFAVDGLAVVATAAVMRLQARRTYAWVLLGSATVVSIVAGAAAHLLPAGPLPGWAGALVAIVPPLCLLVAPHLAVQLHRDERRTSAAPAAAAEGAAPNGDAAPSATPHAAPAAPAAPHPAAPTANSAASVRHPQVNTGAAPAARVVDLGARRTAAPATAAPTMPRAAAPRGGAAVAVRMEDAAPPHPVESAAVPHAAPAAVPHLAVDAAPAAASHAAPDNDGAALRAEAARLLAAGASLRAISRELGVADRTIRRWRDSGLLAS